MVGDPETSRIEKMLARAVGGSSEAIGQVLEAHRAYLTAVASEEINPLLWPKAGSSDLVQQACLEAHRDFGSFAGENADDLAAWLRRILLNNVANLTRQYLGTDKRQVGLEIRLDASSRIELKESLRTDLPAPDEHTLRQERLDRLRQALVQLPQPFQEVIRCRNLELQPFAAIALTMKRTEKAVQMLWSRAIRQLQELLENVR